MTVLGVPLTRVGVQARQIHLGALLATVLAAALYGAGWTTRKTVAGVWFAATWCVAAVRLGWREAGDRGTA